MILNTSADPILFKNIMLKQPSFVDIELLIYWFILLPRYFRTCIKSLVFASQKDFLCLKKVAWLLMSYFRQEHVTDVLLFYN